MKKLKLLKLITDIFWFGLLLGLIIITISFFVSYTSQATGFSSLEFKGKLINEYDVLQLAGLIFFEASQVLLIYVVYLFRRIVHLFYKAKYFDNAVVMNFEKMGKVLIIIAVLGSLEKYLVPILMNEEKYKIFILKSEDLIFLGVGFFSLLLSEIFKVSKNLKQENDLTI